jgi:glycosyl transferase family 25
LLPEIFVINLNRSLDRLNSINKLFNSYNADFTRVEAIDGKDILDLSSVGYNDKLNQKLYHKPLNKGEIACILSHKRALTKFIETSDNPVALILEDDAYFNEDLLIFSSKVHPSYNNWDVIKLHGGKKAKKQLKTIPIYKGYSLGFPCKIPNSNLGQLVSKKGAEKILKLYDNFAKPADVILQNWWQSGLVVLHCTPNLVHSNESKSIINSFQNRNEVQYSKSKKLKQKIRFEFELLHNKPDLSILEKVKSSITT